MESESGDTCLVGIISSETGGEWREKHVSAKTDYARCGFSFRYLFFFSHLVARSIEKIASWKSRKEAAVICNLARWSEKARSRNPRWFACIGPTRNRREFVWYSKEKEKSDFHGSIRKWFHFKIENLLSARVQAFEELGFTVESFLLYLFFRFFENV